MTSKEEQKIYDEAYQKAKEYKDLYYDVSEHCRLPLGGRREVEGLLNQIGEVLKKYGVGFGGKYPPMGHVHDFLITWWNTDRRIDFNISNHNTCWHKIIFEPTKDEMEKQWRQEAEDAVIKAKNEEKEAREKAELERVERERFEAAEREREEYERKMREELESRDRPMHEFIDHVHSVVEGMLKRSNGWFAEDHCTDDQLIALKRYVRSCHDFSDAMNMGLSGLGLYSQNEARTVAHEDLLEAFDADNDRARRVTKDIDFVDTWDPISGKYEHLDEDRSIDALAWALIECHED